MKMKKKAALAAAALLTVTGFSACGNVGEGVYGPPPETSNYEKTETDIPDTNYDPEDNVEPAVYGPPMDN